MIKTRMPGILMLILNFFMAVALFSFFQSIGWISVTEAMPLWAVVVIVGFLNVIVSIAMAVLLVIASPVILIIAACTLGIGLILIDPIFTYLIYYVTSRITGLFTMPLLWSPLWWQALIIGLAFGWLRFSRPSSSSSD